MNGYGECMMQTVLIGMRAGEGAYTGEGFVVTLWKATWERKTISRKSKLLKPQDSGGRDGGLSAEKKEMNLIEITRWTMRSDFRADGPPFRKINQMIVIVATRHQPQNDN